MRDVIVRELVSSLLVHREYTDPCACRMAINRDRIETTDPSRGDWKVRLAKEGYDDVWSDEMHVAPEHTNVAINMLRSAAPTVTEHKTDEEFTYVDVAFDQLMKTGATPTATVDGAAVTGATWQDAVTGRDETGQEAQLSRTLRVPLPAELKAGRTATVALSGGESYAGKSLGNTSFEITKRFPDVPAEYMAGHPVINGEVKSFTDVADKGKYYYTAVRWASSVGVVSGYGNGRFGPDDLITREQLAAMLANYAAKMARKDTSGSATDFQSMKDAAKVSNWAVSSVGWCFRSGIISGTEDGCAIPQGTTARAEAAKMVVCLHDLP